MGCRSIAFIALGILSCIFTMAGTALPVVTLEEAQGSGGGGVFVYTELDVKISLWKICARAVGGVRCSAPATCTSSESVYDQCDTIDEGCLLSFIQAGRAFAILSCLAAFFGCIGGGAADVAGVLPVGRFVLAGIAGCLFVFELLAFCMFLGIWTTSCNGADSLSNTENTAWGPMPILFCLGMVLCVILLIVALASSDPQADADAGSGEQHQAAEPAGHHQPTVGLVVEPSGGPGVEGDWVWAGEWGLWWSATEALYLDHETGWYFEPYSQQWYQPDTGEWTVVSMARSLPSGPPSNSSSTAPAEENPRSAEEPPADQPSPAAGEASPHADAAAGEEDAHLAADPGDFVMDEGSGLYWSDSHAVYMDPQSSMRYCPNRERWYDPEARRWVHPE